ncbi:MAG: coenzyme F420-0:L-glutamate ligase, partial [Nitrososphaerales archaeon]
MTRIELIEVKVERKSPNFNLVDVILRAIETNGEEIHNGDILAISSKFVAMSENRVVNLSNVELTDRGKRLSHE